MEYIATIDPYDAGYHAGYVSCLWHIPLALGVMFILAYLQKDCRFFIKTIFRRRPAISVKPMSGMSYFEQYRK